MAKRKVVGLINQRDRATSNATTSSDPGSGAWRSHLVDHAFPITTVTSPNLTITAAARDVLRKACALSQAEPLAAAGTLGNAKDKSQFYTRADLAELYYRRFREYFDPAEFQLVEPSAGWGAFLQVMPDSSFGCDIEPMRLGIYTADFLSLTVNTTKPVACIGNPPFGRNANLAVRFFNHAANQSRVIAFIVPRTFRKAATINRLNNRFHLLHEEIVPANAYSFEGASCSVPTVFQIWQKRDQRRTRLPDTTTHRDFVFTSRENADFAIQRVGQRAGRVHDALWRSGNAHYFIKGGVKMAMREIGPSLALAALDTAGQPSLSKSEIVAIYDAHVNSKRRTR